MADWIYVDNSNVFIEGKRVSAVERGQALDIFDAMRNNIFDNTYRLRFEKLRQFVAGVTRQNDGRLVLFGSRPPITDEIWSSASRAGYEVIVEDRNASNKEKRIDTGIATAMLEDSFQSADPKSDVFTLISGDGDYIPVIRSLKKRGFQIDIVFWDHASDAVKREASNFYSLNALLETLSY